MPVPLATLRLRPEQPGDEAFLRKVFEGTRRDELAASGLPAQLWPQFLEMQFKAQQRGYHGMFPEADFLVILLGDLTVGRMVVHRAAAEWLLVDIAVLPEHRNQGIGTALIQKLSSEAAAAGKPLRLTVIKDNPACRLYQRLGFVKIGEAGLRDVMEWRPVSS